MSIYVRIGGISWEHELFSRKRVMAATLSRFPTHGASKVYVYSRILVYIYVCIRILVYIYVYVYIRIYVYVYRCIY